MRGTVLRALLVSFVAGSAGCFTTNGASKTDGSAKQAAAQTPTHAYWQKANETLSRQPAGGDLKSLVQLVSEQTATLRELPPEGVDADLVAAVREVISCEEKVIERAELAGYDADNIRRSREMATLFTDANRRAADAKKRLRALNEVLNKRYGGGFAVMRG